MIRVKVAFETKFPVILDNVWLNTMKDETIFGTIDFNFDGIEKDTNDEIDNYEPLVYEQAAALLKDKGLKRFECVSWNILGKI